MKAPRNSIYNPVNPETLGSFFQRIRNGNIRKPLRTRAELAEEFGIKQQSLQAYMNHDPESPKPIYRTGTQRTKKNTWYDPDQVRAWWKQKQDKTNEQ